MISINKEKSKSKQLYNLSMPQEKEHHQNDLSSSIPKHTKLIHKQKKHPLIGHKKKQEDRIPKHLTKDRASNSKVNLDQDRKDTPDYWLKKAKEWYQDSQARQNACIEQEMNNLPTLSSIQQLFSLSSSGKLTNEVDVDCFYSYCRMVSFLDGNDGTKIILTGETASGVGLVGTDRQGNHVINSIYMTSLEELQAIQKRASFMEKLKENQAKYDTSIGRMSEISKELAFNYRVYLQKRSQLADSFNSLSAKILPSHEKPSSAYEQYTRLLIIKNIRHAFNRTEVDPLNYFKFKEYTESNRADPFRHILNNDDLKMFIDRRRPKRGRKMQLATACSVCLSDYYEMSNPFQSCGSCGLRAHRMCYAFENSKCGNCAYQKVQRHVKQQVSSCFICKQRGLMTIKLGEKQFAHAFCLLVHGFWRLSSDNMHQEDDLDPMEAIGRFSSEDFLQPKFRKNCSNEIEFVNPNQNCITASIPAIDSTIYASHQIGLEQIDSESNQSLGRIGIIGEREEAWEHLKESKRSICKCCQQSIYKNCYLACESCQQESHILCAFLSGFDLKLSENAWPSGFQNFISLNCCCDSSIQVSWSRKYRLNYQKIAYNTGDTFENVSSNFMKNDKDGLFFNI